MKFPREEVTAPDMELWSRAIEQVILHGPAQVCLGAFKTDGHKRWEWRVDAERGRLYWQNEDKVEVFGHVRRGRYRHIRTSRSGIMRGDMATVEESTADIKKSVQLLALLSGLSPPQLSWTFYAVGDKHGYGMISRSQEAPTG